MNERWDVENPPSLILELLESSDKRVTMGAPNDLSPGSSLTVNFGDPALQYSFSSNRIDIEGENGEQVEFEVILPQGYFPEEITDDEILDISGDIDVSFERVKETTTSISYLATINENLDNDFESLQTTLQLVPVDGYRTTGITFLQIIKPIKTVRDVNTNPAANFYNLDDTFHRTFGENWLYDSGDDQCEWSSWAAFSFPVEVEADDANAILYDDGGNDDPSDDVYHHAFKIGFDTPTNPDVTTNSFNLKRWFNNESTNSATSPGFNINPALEFFPESGTSTTNGTVQIEEQIITISSREDAVYNLAIAGEGTYKEVDEGLIEIQLVLEVTNDDLFGGTVSSNYLIYNQQVYPEPVDLTSSDCVTPIDL